MTSLSAEVASWNSNAYYKLGDTVRHGGRVWLCNVVATSLTVGLPPYSGNAQWAPLDQPFPTPPAPSPITAFIQAGADVSGAVVVISVRWEGGDGGDVNTITSTPNNPTAVYFDEESQSASVEFTGVTQPFTQTLTLTISDGTGSVTKTLKVSSPAPPPPPVISLVAFSIDETTGGGVVAITFKESATLPIPVYQLPTSFLGIAEGVDANYGFSYNRANGTAVFSNLKVNGEPAQFYRVYMEGQNGAGVGGSSNKLGGGFDPSPPLPTNATNLAVLTFLTNAGGSWLLNSNLNPLIGNWNPLTGNITGFTSENPIITLSRLQQERVRFLVSIGGAGFNVATAFPTVASAQDFAHSFAYTFLGANTSNPLAWTRFILSSQTMVFDGFDFDFESLGAVDPTILTTLITELRIFAPQAITSMSPQPPYSLGTFRSAFNANGAYSAFPTALAPVGDYNPGVGSNALLSQEFLGYFNYIFVQYYNNQDWEPGSVNFNASVAQWARMCQLALPRTAGTRPRLVMGFASADAQRLYDFADNQLVSDALSKARVSTNAPSIEYFCAGAGFWNSPTAQNAFLSLYNSTSGVEFLPSNVIMLWLNQNGVNPNWTSLPILDNFPGVLPQPTSIQIVTLGVRSGGVTGNFLQIAGSNGATYSNLFSFNFGNLLSPSGRPYTDCNTLKFALSGSASDIVPYNIGWSGASGSASWQFNQGIFLGQNGQINSDLLFTSNFQEFFNGPSAVTFLEGYNSPNSPYIWQINLSDLTNNTIYVNSRVYPQNGLIGYNGKVTNVWLHIIPVS